MQQPLRATARELDPITGLYYVRNRWYDPVANRFVSEDPIGLQGGINIYAYTGNNPLNALDPWGLQGCHFTQVVVELPSGPPVIVKRASAGCKAGASANFLGSARAGPGSYCSNVGCQLRDPTLVERDFVDAALDQVLNTRPENSFCRQVEAAGRAMANQYLQFWDNDTRIEYGGGKWAPMYGEAHVDIRINGGTRVMYLNAPTSRLAVVHEAIHGVRNPNSRLGDTFGDGPVPPFPTVNAAAQFCLGI